MAVLTMTINPSVSLLAGPNQQSFPAGIDATKLDQVRFFGLLLEVSRMLRSSTGVIVSSADTVSLTVTCDNTND